MDTERTRSSKPFRPPAAHAPARPASGTPARAPEASRVLDELEVYRENPIQAVARAALASIGEVGTSAATKDRRQLEAPQTSADDPIETNEPDVAQADRARIAQLISERDHWDVDELTDRLFRERHPNATKVMPGTGDDAEWIAIKQNIVEPQVKAAIETKAAGVATRWSENLHSDSQDNAAADAIFYARHPDLKGTALKPRSAAAKEWIQVHREVVQNKHNELIAEAIKEFPGLNPKVLKSLLVTESRFVPDVVNHFGYAGIAQFGKKAAREVRLKVDGGVDERLDPQKAIPGAAKHLLQKANYLKDKTFPTYGTPNGDEYWKFVLAAYNGGEGPVSMAMADAYKVGIDEANTKGLRGDAAVEYAKNYACTWDNLRRPQDDFTASPLYKATYRFYRNMAEDKYNEIGRYPVSIMKRAGQ